MTPRGFRFRPSSLLALTLVAACADVPFDEVSTSELGEAENAVSVCGTSIQAAINAAAPDAVLEICPGTYTERLTISGKRIELRGTGGAAATVINGNQGGRVVTVSSTGGAGVTLRGLTLKNGRASSPGGGVSCSGSTLKLRDVVVTNNVGVGGGGLYATGCALDVTGSQFDTNNASSELGGGALLISSSGVVSGNKFLANVSGHGGGVATDGGTVELSDNEIRGNSGTRGGGAHLSDNGLFKNNLVVDNEGKWTAGGIYVDVAAPRIEGNTVADNTSVNDGGGIYLHQSPAVVIDNDITGNHCGDDGGGVRAFESAARIEGNRIEGNIADDSGGGIRISHVASQVIDNVVRGNRAKMGAGMDLDNDSSVVRGGLVADNVATNYGGGISIGLWPWNGGAIEDVQFIGNEAGSRGGALYVVDNYQAVKLRGLTVRDNKAGRGAGLFIRSTTHTLANSVFAGNRATGDGGAIHIAAPTWSKACPCPPASPVADHDFVVAYGNTGNGSALWTATTGVSIENSILASNDGTGVVVSGGVAAPTWRYNLALPRSFAGMSDPTGSSGNLSADPKFVSPAAANFALAGGSPAIDAGDPAKKDKDNSRADLGLFGGPLGGPKPCSSCPAPALAATLVADAHVAAASPNTNFGGASAIEADTSPQTQAYLRFTISGSGGVATARLRLAITNGTVDAPQVFAAGSGWGESTITWNNKPATTGGVVADVGGATGGFVEYDVSSLVTGDGTYTLALVPTSSDGFAASSREGGTAPVLLYTPGAPTGPACGDATCEGGETCDTCASDCGACPVTGPTVTLLADGQVVAAQPSTAFGTGTSLGVDGDPVLQSYLRFQVSGVTTSVTSAKLRLKVTDATSDGPAVYKAAGGWTEAGLTYNNRPALIGSPVADLGPMSIGQTVEYDVTSLITGDGTFDLALVATSSSGFAASSREGGTPPQLVVAVSSGPPPVCGDAACVGGETCDSCQADCGVCPAPGPTATLLADAQVAAAAPTTNAGSASSFGADASPVIESYLRFQIADLTGPITRARLLLTVTDATSDGPAIYKAAGGWSESTVTWNTKPALVGGVVADLGSMSVGQVVEYDVTSLVTANGALDLAVIPTSSSGFAASSKESGSPPRLVIEE